MIVFDRLYERVAKLSKENAAIIADYVISMKTEINSSDYYRRDWHEKSKDRVLFDSNLATVNYPAGKAPGSVTYMRNFDPERFVLTFRNRDYEINEVVKATTQLLKKIKAMD